MKLRALLSRKSILPLTLLAVSLLVHGFFYVSATQTGTLDPLYENITPGQDFYQVVNGAYAYGNGGSLQGDMPEGQASYTSCCGVNRNVYHPVFTLLVGTPLSKLSPRAAYMLWVALHALVSLYMLCILRFRFRTHKLLIPALSVYLLFSYHYYEIKMAQYHFLVALCIFLHFLELERKNDGRAGIFLFLSLLVKPVGLLFLLPLLLAGRLKTVLIASGLFAAVTIPTLFIPGMEYYVQNIKNVASSDVVSYNLFALTYFFPSLMLPLMTVKFFSAGMLLAYQIIRRPPLFVLLTAWTAFQILFYGSVYPYYYVTFSGIIAMGMVTGFIRPVPVMAIAIVLLSLPQPAWYFHLMGSPSILPTPEYLTIAVTSSLALVFFTILLILSNRDRLQSGS